MGSDRKVILVCGPESTGKSTICRQMALRLNARMIVDYSRFYLSAYGLNYDENDISIMAQIHQNQLMAIKDGTIILDSFLLNYKIWLAYKYGSFNPQIEESLKKFKPDVCLLMQADLPWEPDLMRENELDRHKLFSLYEKEIDKLGWSCTIISGKNDVRLEKALDVLAKEGMAC